MQLQIVDCRLQIELHANTSHLRSALCASALLRFCNLQSAILAYSR
ncbi:hypothetical protein K2Z83_27975 [Oscillochloris sp. ZM17-4]|nr:hypothetical protein [Oscillochloris sp. ZM17-4]MBX0331496.1 hypothetical protein [Oscillochloris sp. ZM17-4]